jgi:plasmid stabilization system protein ParE
MSYRLSIKEEAVADMSEAYRWYEERRTGLGEEFLEALEQAFSRIQANPLLYRKQSKERRLSVLQRFPYVLIFEEAAEEVVVYAVFHTSRHPQSWKKRK